METNNTTTSNGVHNTHTKDNAAKIVFGDPVLCAQFLKGYTDVLPNTPLYCIYLDRLCCATGKAT